MNTINIRLYDTLRKELNLSEEKSRAVTQAIEQAVLDEIKSDGKEAATKSDIEQLRTSTKLDIEQVRREISEAKSDMLKWFIGLFIALALMIIGLYLK